MESPLVAQPFAPPPEPRRVVVRRVGILSLAKVQGVIMAAIGLLLGLVFALVPLSVGAALGEAGVGQAEGPGLAAMALFFVVFFPLLYGAMGFVMGALMAGAYNLAAGRFGGLEMEIA